MGKVDLVALLIKHGADPQQQTSQGLLLDVDNGSSAIPSKKGVQICPNDSCIDLCIDIC